MARGRRSLDLAESGAEDDESPWPAFGDIALAFSTGRNIPAFPGQTVFALLQLATNYIDTFFTAAADAVEESILNAMFMAETVVGRDGNMLRALPLDKVKSLLENG